MVKDYLEKIRQEYIEHKVSLEEQISLYENKVKREYKVSSGFREGNKSRV